MIVIQGSILLKDSDDEILLTLAVAYYCVLRRPESRNYIIDDVTSLKSMIRPAR